MIMIIGDWEKNKEPFDKAKEHLLDTEKYHKIYGTDAIINSAEILEGVPFLDYKQQVNLLLLLLSYCDTAYMLKGWESNNDVRLLHDYADNNGYKIIYSKKF